MALAKKGERVLGSGRKKGTPNKKTKELMEILEGKNFSPADELIYCYRELQKVLEFRKKNKNFTGAVSVLESMADVAGDLAQYVYPKKKAIEHSGEVGVRTFSDFIASADDEDEDEE